MHTLRGVLSAVVPADVPAVVPAAQLHWTNDRGAHCGSNLGEIGKIGGDKFLTRHAL